MRARLLWVIPFGALAMGACNSSSTKSSATTTTTSGSASGTGGGGGAGGGVQCTGEPNCVAGEVGEDTDEDGCIDQCCFVDCGNDRVVVDLDDDGCGDTCNLAPCSSNLECDEFLCLITPGTCDAPEGTCTNMPCSGAGPVCGCDGNTYLNQCEAQAADVGVDFEGVCP